MKFSFLSAAPLSDAKPISAVPPSPAQTTTVTSLFLCLNALHMPEAAAGPAAKAM